MSLLVNQLGEALADMKARAKKAEAQVQATRELCERSDMPAVAGDWVAGYAAARRDVLHVLDKDGYK